MSCDATALDTLTESKFDSAPRQVVRGQFHRYEVAGHYLNGILSHFSTGMRQNLMVVFQFDLIGAVGHVLNNPSLQLDGLFLGHKQFPPFLKKNKRLLKTVSIKGTKKEEALGLFLGQILKKKPPTALSTGNEPWRPVARISSVLLLSRHGLPTRPFSTRI